jgi:uncharacterized protein (TIGR02569 family)
VIPGPVLRAFGLAVDIPLRPMGRVFAAGDLVLKQADDEVEASWTAQMLSTLEPDGFRLAPPVRADDGRWVVDGWTATRRVRGRVSRDWDEVLAAGAAFHRAVAHVPRPDVLDARTHLWAVADRAAWGEAAPPRTDPLVDALVARLRPLHLPSQVVHGDLSGNVLTADGEVPAVIDVSPYWRPIQWAAAIVAVDAVVWGRAAVELADGHEPQVLARATLFRLFCDHDIEPHRRWVEHLCHRLDAGT